MHGFHVSKDDGWRESLLRVQDPFCVLQNNPEQSRTIQNNLEHAGWISTVPSATHPSNRQQKHEYRVVCPSVNSVPAAGLGDILLCQTGQASESGGVRGPCNAMVTGCAPDWISLE